MISNPLKAAIKITWGTYVGDGNNNRAIPHGQANTPKFVIGRQAHTGVSSAMLIYNQVDAWLCLSGVARETNVVTIADTTNFYVGAAGKTIETLNNNAWNYLWVAMAE